MRQQLSCGALMLAADNRGLQTVRDERQCHSKRISPQGHFFGANFKAYEIQGLQNIEYTHDEILKRELSLSPPKILPRPPILKSHQVEAYHLPLIIINYSAIISGIFIKPVMSSFFQSNKKWAIYEEGDFTFLERHNYHQKLARFDVRYRKDSSKIQIQESLHENVEGKVSSTGQIKFQLPIGSKDRTLYSRISSQGKFGLHFDNGLLQLTTGQKLNFYAAFQSNRTFNDNVYKFGGSVISQNYLWALRMRFGAKHNNLLLHTKGSYQGQWGSNKWKTNFFTLFDPNITKIVKNGILFGLFLNNPNKDTFYLRVQSGKKNFKGLHWCQLFKQYKLNWSRQVSENTKIGAETKLNLGNWEHILSNAAIGAQWKLPEQRITLRSKFNANFTHTCSITHELPGYGEYSFGVEWSGIGAANNFKFGTAIELNL